MKTLSIIFLTFFLADAIHATELSWVDEQIEAIKPPRKSPKILGINNPFVFLEKNGYVKKSSSKESSSNTKNLSSSKNSSKSNTNKNKIVNDNFILSTIINSSAMINGNWYKKNDKINDYLVIKITKDSVKLKKGNKKLTLSTDAKKQNLKFKNK